jgi:hypothetical protein
MSDGGASRSLRCPATVYLKQDGQEVRKSFSSSLELLALLSYLTAAHRAACGTSARPFETGATREQEILLKVS